MRSESKYINVDLHWVYLQVIDGMAIAEIALYLKVGAYALWSRLRTYIKDLKSKRKISESYQYINEDDYAGEKMSHIYLFDDPEEPISDNPYLTVGEVRINEDNTITVKDRLPSMR